MVVSSIKYWWILRTLSCPSVNLTLPVWRGGELRLVERLDSSLCLANGLVLLSGNLLDVNYINIWKITGSPSKDYSLPYAIYWTSIVVN